MKHCMTTHSNIYCIHWLKQSQHVSLQYYCPRENKLILQSTTLYNMMSTWNNKLSFSFMFLLYSFLFFAHLLRNWVGTEHLQHATEIWFKLCCHCQNNTHLRSKILQSFSKAVNFLPRYFFFICVKKTDTVDCKEKNYNCVIQLHSYHAAANMLVIKLSVLWKPWLRGGGWTGWLDWFGAKWMWTVPAEM